MAEKHHYISRFYLNYFSPVKHPGKVWVYSANRPELRSIKKFVACIEDFYTIDTDEGESKVIEKELGKLESYVGRVIKKLNEKKFDLSKDELNTLIVFISYLRARTPALRDSVNKSVSMERKIILKMITNNEVIFNSEMGDNLEELEEKDRFTFDEFQKYISNNIEKMNLNMNNNEASKVMIVAAKELQKMLLSMKWSFLIAPENFNYITSDQPIIPFMNKWKKPYQPGFAFKEVEVYFPVTPKICMMGTYMDVSICKVVTGDAVNVINARVLNNCYNYVYSNMKETEFTTQSDITLNKFGYQ